jgi:two-component system cell cycle sensor histidine kinase/response regulator CckA
MMPDGREGAGPFSRQRTRPGQRYSRITPESSPHKVAVVAANQGCIGRMTLPEQSVSLESPVLDSLPDGVSVCDENGFLVYTNPADDRLFGYGRGELIGQHLGVRTRYPLEESRRLLAEVLREITRGGVWVGNLSSRRKDGTGFTSHARFTGLDLAGRRLPVCLQQDVTEVQRLQERIHLEQRLDATGRLAGGIAHDLNNMLAAILGFSELLVRGMDSEDPKRHDVEQIRIAATRSATLMTQLLAFARRDLIQPEHVDLNSVVRHAEAVIHFATGEGIEVKLDLSSKVGPIFADPRRVEQVLMNLVLNARDAMPAGGRLTIATTSTHLDSDYGVRYGVTIAPGRYAGLVVSDSGHGIEPSVLTRIWEPFFTTKPIGGGTGLGLSMVYGAVKQSGGFVWAESEPGKGTKMRVHWPELPAARSPSV